MPDDDKLDALGPDEITRLTLIGRRDVMFSRLQEMYNHSLRAATDEISKDLFLCGMTSLERLRLEFNDLVDKLNILELTLNPAFRVNYQCVGTFDEMYCQCKFAFDKLDVTGQLGKLTVSEVLPQRKSVKLPKLELMEFCGEPIKWPIFYESFRRTIHENCELSDHERVQYLINKLSGRALSACSGIVPNADNYRTIWSTLIDMYEDKRNLAAAYLDQMLEYKSSNNATSKNLTSFLDKFCTAASSLKSLNLDNLSDFMLLHVALKKIDSSTARSFEMHHRDTSMPTYDDLVKYIRGQSKILDRTATPYNRSTNDNSRSTHSFAATGPACPLCKQNDHYTLFKCPEFSDCPIDERFNFIKEQGGCSNCLSVTHSNAACNSKYTCRYCACKHHSMLCRKNTLSHNDSPRSHANIEQRAPAPQYRAPTRPAAALHAAAPPYASSESVPVNRQTEPCARTMQQNVSLCNMRTISSSNSTCLLGTVQVYATDLNGHRHVVRALIDSGSQSNFITSKCCKNLNSTFIKVSNMFVKGIGSAPNPVKGVTSLVLNSRLNNNFISLDAYVIKRITDNMPTAKIDLSLLSYLNRLQLADDSFSSPSEIDILIGAPLFSQILLSGRAAGPPGTPTALETIFGFIVIGNAPIASDQTTAAAATGPFSLACAGPTSVVAQPLSSLMEEPCLDKILQKFWQVEEVECIPVLSSAAREAEELFRKDMSRDRSGRYSVALPFSRDPTALGNSYFAAKKRFMYLERKLSSSDVLRVEYDAIIREYLQMGYISLLENDDHLSGYYIPHHAVARLDKTTTKWRMVMDASSKTDLGLALNDILHAGENLQNELFLILLDFRLYKTAFTSDIKQMYLRIMTNESDRKFQKFLYRFDPSLPLDTYRFNVVCFGLRSSPFLAIRVLRQLCEDESIRFPLASSVIKRNTYMDDVCFSMPTVAGSLQLRDDLRELLKAGGFDLVKWASNSPEITESLLVSDRHTANIQFEDPDSKLKVLGLQWSPVCDDFMFSVSVENRPVTKRNMLSLIARQYDVLGLIAPVVLYAKLILQKLHLIRLDWDEQPPLDIVNIWLNYTRELPCIQELRFGRHLGVYENSRVIIVAFADASEKAYGAVVYIRTQHDDDSRPVTRLICAKSKVAPLKTISIARLELSACLLMSKLVRRVIDTFERRHIIDDVFYFTDWLLYSGLQHHRIDLKRLSRRA